MIAPPPTERISPFRLTARAASQEFRNEIDIQFRVDDAGAGGSTAVVSPMLRKCWTISGYNSGGKPNTIIVDDEELVDVEALGVCVGCCGVEGLEA